jgi:hypothetical protein
MNLPSVDAISLLQTAGHVNGATGWKGCQLSEPATPDQTVTIYDTAGMPPEGYGLEYPSIQIRVRGGIGKQVLTYQKIKDIRDYLENCSNTVIGGTSYDGFEIESDIGFLMHDSTNRPIYVCNIRILRRN